VARPDGRPCCTVAVRTPESTDAWRVEAYADQLAVAETLMRGDHVAVQGRLSVKSPRTGRTADRQHQRRREPVPATAAYVYQQIAEDGGRSVSRGLGVPRSADWDEPASLRIESQIGDGATCWVPADALAGVAPRREAAAYPARSRQPPSRLRG
jgi:hypothetical protein